MRKRIKKKKLGRTKTHRESLMRNLLRSLFDHNYVVTTTAKAKALKQEATSLIEIGKNKKGDKLFREKLNVLFGNRKLVGKYEDYLKKDAAGIGFVRVGFRDGDNAEMSRVFLLGLDKKKAPVKKSKKQEKKQKGLEPEDRDKGKSPLDIKEDKPTGLKKKVDKTGVIRKKPRAKARAGL
jgi:large subunit ribosomal protein L17